MQKMGNIPHAVLYSSHKLCLTLCRLIVGGFSTCITIMVTIRCMSQTFQQLFIVSVILIQILIFYDVQLSSTIANLGRKSHIVSSSLFSELRTIGLELKSLRTHYYGFLVIVKRPNRDLVSICFPLAFRA